MLSRKEKLQEITISNWTVVRILMWVLATAAAVAFVSNAIHPLTLIFVSFFLTLALNPAVHWLASKMKSRSRVIATSLAYLTVVLVLVTFGALVLPPLVNQTAKFIEDVPNTLRDLQSSPGAVGNFVRNNNLDDQISQFASNWSNDFGSISSSAFSLANRVVSNLISIVTVFVLTFMMLVDGPGILKKFWERYPSKRRKHDKMIAGKMYRVVTGYVNGQVFVAAIGATIATIAMLIISRVMNVDGVNAVAMGGIIFLFALIPTVGTILGAAIVILFISFLSLPMAAVFALYFIVYQQIENVSIQPYIQSRSNELPPLIVFMSAILGIGFGGALGAFVAIPVAGCLKVLIDDYFSSQETPEPEVKVKKLKLPSLRKSKPKK